MTSNKPNNNALERIVWAAIAALLAFKSIDLSWEKDKVEIKLQRAEAQQQNEFGLAGVECMNDKDDKK